MTTSLPMSINGRPVHLECVSDPIASSLAESVWNIIQNHAEYGLWYRINATIGIDKRTLKQLQAAIKMRIYMRGWDEVLKVRIADRDGFCFQWLANPEDDEQKVRIETLKRERLTKKMSLNRQHKKRKHISQ